MQKADMGRVSNPDGLLPQSIFGVFNRVNRLIPDDQEVLRVSPDMRVADALALMREKSYSQLPVTMGDTVLGVFSYRSLVLSLLDTDATTNDFGDTHVGDCLEDPPYVTIETELATLIEDLDRMDAVVVGHSSLLQAILTPMDVVRYLSRVANAFVLLWEVELALRTLIRWSVSDAQLATCVSHALNHYAADKRPAQLEDFTFDDYISVLRDRESWPLFGPTFGGNRDQVRARLEPIRKIRNDVLHFKKPENRLSVDEHQKLVSCRNWLLGRVRYHDAALRITDVL